MFYVTGKEEEKCSVVQSKGVTDCKVNYCLLEQQYQFADRYVLTHHCYWLHEDHIICDWRCYYWRKLLLFHLLSKHRLQANMFCEDHHHLLVIPSFLTNLDFWHLLVYWLCPSGRDYWTKLTPSSFGPTHLRNVHHVLCRVHLVPDFDECSPCVCYSELWVWFLRNFMEHFRIVTVAGLNLR
jgi:hypothetical protein